MELKEYWRIIIQRGWIVVLAALLTGASAYGWSRMQPPQYRSTARLIVRADSMDYGRLQTTRQVLASYAERIRSPEFAAAVVDTLQLDQSSSEILSRVNVSPLLNELVMQIDATDSDPEMTRIIANGFANEFFDQIEEANAGQLREDRIILDLIAEAGPGGQIGPRPSLMGLAGALLGLLLGGLIVLAVELLDDTVKSRDDIERYIGKDLMLLGQVPPGQPDLAPTVPAPSRFSPGALGTLQETVRRA
jgi:capsular polysaccharide biosynthesis protein